MGNPALQSSVSLSIYFINFLIKKTCASGGHEVEGGEQPQLDGDEGEGQCRREEEEGDEREDDLVDAREEAAPTLHVCQEEFYLK